MDSTPDRNDYDSFEEWIAEVADEAEVAPDGFQTIVEQLGDEELPNDESRVTRR